MCVKSDGREVDMGVNVCALSLRVNFLLINRVVPTMGMYGVLLAVECSSSALLHLSPHVHMMSYCDEWEQVFPVLHCSSMYHSFTIFWTYILQLLQQVAKVLQQVASYPGSSPCRKTVFLHREEPGNKLELNSGINLLGLNYEEGHARAGKNQIHMS